MPNKETKKTALVRKQRSPILYIFIVFAIIALLTGGFFELKKRVDTVAYRQVRIGSQMFKLEIADTQAQREKGLSQRDSIPAIGGMLFDFKEYGDWRMWMLQMRFPLDIAWLTKEGKIIYIKHDAQPGDYPEIYHASQPSWYAVEVNAGTFERLGVKEGDTLQLY